MSDIRTSQVLGSFRFDWSLAPSAGGEAGRYFGLAEDDGLQTAVIISLFTDRRADDADRLPGADDKRGWWADAYAEIDGDKIGSRLWLLAREKQTQLVLVLAKAYAEEALAWLLEDGIARAVNVSAEIVREGVLGLGIEILRAAAPPQKYRFETFWKPT